MTADGSSRGVTQAALHADLLAATSLFAGADPEALEPVAAAGRLRELVRGDVLFREGDPPDALYLVTRGRVAIAMASPVDRRESVVALMEPGDLFGELGLLDDGPRSALARALEPSAVLEVPFEPVRALLTEHPELLWNVARLLAGRLRVMDEVLADSVFLDVTGRTAKRLLELSGDDDEFTLPVTQEELAGMVGASRERVNKSIATFIKLGWLEQNERTYKIVQRRQLELRAR
jgi:CRP/FNR family cyclic AMP-dependent transcriptional regulator